MDVGVGSSGPPGRVPLGKRFVRPVRRFGQVVLAQVRRVPVPSGIREHVSLMSKRATAISGVGGLAGIYGAYAAIAGAHHPDPWFWLFLCFAVLFAAQISTVHGALRHDKSNGAPNAKWLAEYTKELVGETKEYPRDPTHRP